MTDNQDLIERLDHAASRAHPRPSEIRALAVEAAAALRSYAKEVEAPEVIRDALLDSQYLAGVTAGWNAAQSDDPNAALISLQQSRAGHLAGFKGAKAVLARAALTPADPA